MDGFETPRRQGKGDGKRRRPWDIGGSAAEEAGTFREEGKLVEFPTRSKPAPERADSEQTPVRSDALLESLVQQRQRLVSVRTELENASRHHEAKRREVEQRRSELEADIAGMRAALASVAAQIREVDLIEEVLRELLRSE